MGDRLCRENGVSVVAPQKGGKGKSYAEYIAEKTGTSWKGKLKIAVDALIPQVSSFEELLSRLQAAGYEIKPGKYVSCRAPGQERFTRLKTLGADYTEEAIRERIEGRRTRAAKAPKRETGVSLLIDIENSIKAAQSRGYEQWAKIHNLKQAAKTLNFLTEHQISQYEDLTAKIEEVQTEIEKAGDALKEVEKRLADMAGINITEMANNMFQAASSLQGKTPEEICYQDFKIFNNEGRSFGVSQVTSMDSQELDSIREKVEEYLPQVMEQQDLDMMFMMMTNIVDTSTELLCCGLHADLLAKEAFDIADGDEHIILKDIVSRKKQFLPAFVEALHQ